MLRLPANVWILTAVQALMMSVTSFVVFVGGIIGAELAPVENLATLPVALIIVGTASTVVPMTLLMKKIGRKKAFLFIAFLSLVFCLVAAYALYISSFYLLCLGTFLFGMSVATVMQFRFAAMESVETDLMPKAASCVLLGGIIAAFIGPEIALLGKDILAEQYVGSFLLLSALYVLGFGLLVLFKNPEPPKTSDQAQKRPLTEIMKQRVFWVALLSAAVGYVVMSFIMTATPVSMHVMDGHSLSDTKVVIQSHILAMFVPSLIAGWLISKIGIKRMMLIGLVAYVICLAIAYSGHDFGNYWVSLVLLGLGWNFLFIGGTALLPQSYNASEKFKVQALNDFIVFGTQSISALSAGWLVFALGWETILLLTLPIILAQMLIIFRWRS